MLWRNMLERVGREGSPFACLLLPVSPAHAGLCRGASLQYTKPVCECCVRLYPDKFPLAQKPCPFPWFSDRFRIGGMAESEWSFLCLCRKVCVDGPEEWAVSRSIIRLFPLVFVSFVCLVFL